MLGLPIDTTTPQKTVTTADLAKATTLSSINTSETTTTTSTAAAAPFSPDLLINQTGASISNIQTKSSIQSSL